MTRVKHALQEMRVGITQRIASLPEASRDSSLSSAMSFLRSIERKCAVLAHHAQLLSGIDWDAFARTGITDLDTQQPGKLTVRGEHWRLEIDHRETAMTFALISLDGLVSGCVNICDTCARLLNVAYEIGIDVRRANIMTLKRTLDPACLLGRVLHLTPGLDWLDGLRQLRGECQHASLSDSLIHPASPLDGPHPEPQINSRFAGSLAGADLSLSRYVPHVVSSTEGFLVAVAAAVVADPANAVIIV